MSFSTWLYVSSCLLSPEEVAVELNDIVFTSRRRNVSLEVSGALLFTGKRFAQYLEGPGSGVSALRESILRDSRHENIIEISGQTPDTRRFSGWSLAYAGPSQFVASVVHKALTEALADSEQGAGILIRLLEKFSVKP